MAPSVESSSAVTARGRLAVLTAHLASTESNQGRFIEPWCASAQSMVPPPGNLKGSLTVVDERTGKRYQIPVSQEGTVKATDFKKVVVLLIKFFFFSFYKNFRFSISIFIIIALFVNLVDLHLQITTGKNDKGLKLYDPGYLNTAPVRSSICYIDGDEGILRYRGYPIEELAESSSFLEVAYLLSKFVPVFANLISSI